MKSLGSNTIGLIKQNRKGKFTFQGRYPLVKFGAFSELSESSENEESSEPLDSANDVITVSEHEDDKVPPIAIVAEEQDTMTNVEVQSDFNKSQDMGGDGDDERFSDDD